MTSCTPAGIPWGDYDDLSTAVEKQLGALVKAKVTPATTDYYYYYYYYYCCCCCCCYYYCCSYYYCYYCCCYILLNY